MIRHHPFYGKCLLALCGITLLLPLSQPAQAQPYEPPRQNDLNSITEGFDFVEQQAQELGLNTPSTGEQADDVVIELIRDIIETFLAIVGIVALALVVWGGFIYLTAAGNEDRAKRGKQIILRAIVGLVIIGLAAVIVNFTIDLFASNSGGDSSWIRDLTSNYS